MHPQQRDVASTFISRLHLSIPVDDATFDELCTCLQVHGRLALLANLKERGMAKLAERQRCANALGRALREHDFTLPELHQSEPLPTSALSFDPYIYAETLVPAERAIKGRAFRPRAMGQLEKHLVLSTPLLPPWPAAYCRCVFAAGCFWGLEKGLWRLPGVHSTATGYACGHTAHPSYSEVCSGLTGHTEAVQVIYDPERIAFADLLRWYWECHDPTQGMGQGADRGTQYRSAIVSDNETQYALAQASSRAYQKALASSGRFFTSGRTITVEILPPPLATTTSHSSFYYAEEHHMQYLARPDSSPYCTAQPLKISLPPYESWAPDGLRESAAQTPKLPESFWAKHAPEEHCALRRPNRPIVLSGL